MASSTVKSDEKLAESVRKYPVLYDKSCAVFREKLKKNNNNFQGLLMWLKNWGQKTVWYGGKQVISCRSWNAFKICLQTQKNIWWLRLNKRRPRRRNNTNAKTSTPNGKFPLPNLSSFTLLTCIILPSRKNVGLLAVYHKTKVYDFDSVKMTHCR